MRLLAPRPMLLALTLILVVGAIAFIELRFNAADAGDEQAAATPSAQHKGKPAKGAQSGETKTDSSGAVDAREAEAEERGEASDPSERKESPEQNQREDASQRVANKETKYRRANEIVNPTGFINTDGVSIKEAAGEKVVLLEFWTYSCYNCQNVQPHINRWHEEYADDGLLVVGVHKPEFEFEKEFANVRQAVRQANIQYPVVLDNNDATWDAYDQRYWPAWYLIDADGFVRYKHFGEGAYDETEKKIQELLKEKDRISN